MPISNPPSGAPAGAIAYMAANAVPHGWIKANGAAISRTIYAGLFLVIGTTHGEGNGSTTFALPDLRGEFVRGWDDSRGIDSGRSFGSFQTDEFKSHLHAADSVSAAYGSGTALYNPNGSRSTGEQNRTTGFNGLNETRPRNVSMLACIKY